MSLWRKDILRLLFILMVFHQYETAAFQTLQVNGHNVRWANQDIPVAYAINRSNFTDVDINAIHNAFAKWGSINDSSLRFRFAGFTDQSRGLEPGPSDNTHLIIRLTNLPEWASTPGTGFAAETIFDEGCIDSSDGHIIDVDIIFNGDLNWSTGTWIWRWEYDVESIALHEIGHFIGLNHPHGDAFPNAENRTSVVEPIGRGEIWRELFLDDIAGVLFLYGINVPVSVQILPETITSTNPFTLDISLTYPGLSSILDASATYDGIELLEALVPFATQISDNGARIVIPDVSLPAGTSATFTVTLVTTHGSASDSCIINIPAISVSHPGGFLSFLEGDPGIPGDGIFISSVGGLPNYGYSFELATPIPLNIASNGLTFIVFLPPGTYDFGNGDFTIETISASAQCHARLSFPIGSPSGTLMFNDVEGIYTNVSQSRLDWAIGLINEILGYSHCDPITINDLYITIIWLRRAESILSLITSLDAAAIFPGLNAFP